MKRFALVGAVVVAALGVGAGASPAFADSSPTVTVTSPIQSGADAQTVGSATFTRAAQSDGSSVVTVAASVPGGISESHLCYSTQPFTSRVPPGQCPLSQGNTGSTATYQLSSSATGTLYFQLHVVTSGNTAYAGWQSGKPFYGNVAVDAPAASTSVPVGTLGGLGVALLAGMALLWTTRRARPATIAEVGQTSRH
ncbi:MAG: hypothetical protein JO155_00415 [Acidimicrobiia bacterium]|nr:hypothetical protein [Acidimicrobiia bacterium]